MLEYEFATLAPGEGMSASITDESPIDAIPERWSLSTVSGGGTVETTEPEATSVRFDVRTGSQTEHIESIRLIGWRVAVPAHERITLDLIPGESEGFAGGTSITVPTILEQSSSTIVLLDVDHPHDRWNRIEFNAVDSDWRRAGRPDGTLNSSGTVWIRLRRWSSSSLHHHGCRSKGLWLSSRVASSDRPELRDTAPFSSR